MTSPTLDILIIRHAETPYNATRDTIGGRTNSLPLSGHGERQALECGLAIARQNAAMGLPVDAIYCSPAVRTRRTLELIREGAPYLKGVPAFYDERLLELSRGEWEGLPAAQIITPWMKERMNADNWHFKAPGGESQWEVEQRMLSILSEILRKHPSGRILIIAHGNAIRCLLRGITGNDPKYTHGIAVENCHTFKIRRTASQCNTLPTKELPAPGWKLLSLNYPPSMIDASEHETTYIRKDKIIINATSDLHGHLPSMEPADIVCIGGDITPDCYRADAVRQAEWFYSNFIPWVESLHCEKVVLIAGNHDYCFEEIITSSPVEKLVYLNNESATVCGLLIFGTPNVPRPTHNLAFYQEPSELLKTFRTIPDRLDILLTHAAPYGVNDCALYGDTLQDIGSRELTEAIKDKEIGWIFCGHIHSGNHIPALWREKHIANVSYCDDLKKPAHPVLQVSYE